MTEDDAKNAGLADQQMRWLQNPHTAMLAKRAVDAVEKAHTALVRVASESTDPNVRAAYGKLVGCIMRQELLEKGNL